MQVITKIIITLNMNILMKCDLRIGGKSKIKAVTLQGNGLAASLASAVTRSRATANRYIRIKYYYVTSVRATIEPINSLAYIVIF